jgi:hypothetical protein
LIRDGLTMKKKRLRKGAKSFAKDEYKENWLDSVIKAIQLASITGKLEYFTYLKDPYSLLLALCPMGVEKEVDSTIEVNSVTAKEYVEAVLSKNIEKIWDRMTAEEQDWCNFWAEGRQEFSPLDILVECAKAWNLSELNVINTWYFQPDPTSLVFAITSPRAPLEHVTPAVGVPYIMITPTDNVQQLRFPLCIHRSMPGFMHVQIHKDGDLFEVYEKNDVLSEYLDEVKAVNHLLTEEVEEFLKSIPHTYVVEGWYKEGELHIWDVLCWNDIWLHERPLSERMQLLWHFHEYRDEPLIVRYKDQIPNDFMYIGRNLNTGYNPNRRDTDIYIGEPTILLRVGGRRGGGKKTFLNTSEGRSVFEVPFYVEKDDRGSVVEVTRGGKVVQILPKNTSPDTWIDVCIHLGLNPDYEAYTYGRMLPKAEWPDDVTTKDADDELADEIQKEVDKDDVHI